MATHVTREIGQSGPMEEVAYVQALLANVTGPNGSPYWDAPIGGQPGDALVAAITAFQQADRDAEEYDRLGETGLIRTPGKTLRRLLGLAPRDLRGITVVADGGRPVIYASGDPYRPGDTVRRTINAVRGDYTAEGRVLIGAYGDSLARAVETLSERQDLELRLEAVDIVGDWPAVRVFPAELSIADPHGRMSAVGGVASRVPAVLWRVIDDAMTREGWERSQVPGWSGEGIYRHRDAVPALARNAAVGDEMFTRFGLPLSGWNSARRVVATVLSLIARADRLTSEEARDLGMLKSAIALKDRDLADRLEARHHTMKVGVSAGTLEYRTPAEIREYLKERGEWDRVVELIGHAALLSGTSAAVGASFTASTPALAGSAGAGAILGVFSILAGGAANVARQVDEERGKLRRAGGQKLAGVTAGAEDRRREALLRIFRVSTENFRMSPEHAEEVLDLMEQVLRDRVEGDSWQDGMRLSERIAAYMVGMEGPGRGVLSHVLHVHRLLRQGDEVVAAPFLPDEELTTYRLRMESWTRALSLFGLVKDMGVLDNGRFNFVNAMVFFLEKEGKSSVEFARETLIENQMNP